MVPIFPKMKGKIITDEFVGEMWAWLFNLPHLAGYDDQEHPWWPLAEFEKTALATPTARWIEQLAPTQQEWIAKFGAPVALVMTLGALVSWRVEMTRTMMHELRVQRETEARRAGLTRGTAATVDRVRGSTNGERDRETLGVETDAGDDAPHSHRVVQDAFS